jgi:hypothetical protein
MPGQTNNKPAPMSLQMWLTTTFMLSSVAVQPAAKPPVNSEQLSQLSDAGNTVQQASAPMITGLRDAPIVQDISMPDVTMGSIVGQQEKIGLPGSIQKNTGTAHNFNRTSTCEIVSKDTLVSNNKTLEKNSTSDTPAPFKQELMHDTARRLKNGAAQTQPCEMINPQQNTDTLTYRSNTAAPTLRALPKIPRRKRPIMEKPTTLLKLGRTKHCAIIIVLLTIMSFASGSTTQNHNDLKHGDTAAKLAYGNTLDLNYTNSRQKTKTVDMLHLNIMQKQTVAMVYFGTTVGPRCHLELHACVQHTPGLNACVQRQPDQPGTRYIGALGSTYPKHSTHDATSHDAHDQLQTHGLIFEIGPLCIADTRFLEVLLLSTPTEFDIRFLEVLLLSTPTESGGAIALDANCPQDQSKVVQHTATDIEIIC